MDKSFCYLILCTKLLLIFGITNDDKVCFGTYQGTLEYSNEPSNMELHYNNLRDRYTGCTYVDGNLEITWIKNDTYDLSFLQDIREVTGYVLISNVYARNLILPKLQIIRGRKLFQYEYMKNDYGLFVFLSQMNTLRLPALKEIINGTVGVVDSYIDCYITTIDWDEIISDPNAVIRREFSDEDVDCQSCDSTCENGCWADGPENCQKFNRLNCSSQCLPGRCFGSTEHECCHEFCAGGCTGPTQKECFGCKNFNDDGECKQECPAIQIKNPTNDLWEPNPDGKYAYGDICVKKCPEQTLEDNGTCVYFCPPNKMNQNGVCEPCVGCLKTCKINQIVHFRTIDIFQGCNIIEGSLDIWGANLEEIDSSYKRCTRKAFDILDELFSSVKEITGFLSIQGKHECLKDLSFLRNLEVIGGKQLDPKRNVSLLVMNTPLESLGLKSLKSIESGAVAILNNEQLCFVEDINWNQIQKSQRPHNNITFNRDSTKCKLDSQICSEECTTAGCWGAGADQCLECENDIYNGDCLATCKSLRKIYQIDMKTCGDCHQECKGLCSGPKADDCDECANFKDDEFCVSECPFSKYSKDGICLNCHDSCNGCTGPRNTFARDGCTDCDLVIIIGNKTIDKCLKKNTICPEGFFNEWVGPNEQGPLKALAGKSICRQCHPRCTKCSGYGFHESVCLECSGYKRGEQCEDECAEYQYADQETRTCKQCDDECQKCHGSGPGNCYSCKNFKLFSNDIKPKEYYNTTLFNCTSVCPLEYKYKVFAENVDPHCSSFPPVSSNDAFSYLYIIAFIIFLSIILLIVLVLFYINRQKTKASNRINQILTGTDYSEPLKPTNVGPNLTKLRIIKEAEIHRGGILGMGAFGKVYKGVWIPENENVKIPVAIKVLMDMSGSESSKEFLDEAYIMCSVEHPNLLKLHAVCMTSQMMLITQLMPLGCLLDYVRSNKDKIGSKALLNWSTQIARGMSYLEERRLVHRDLAARNVLVQTPSCVKITDFGLAKLLDYDSDTYQSAGGKMPIKWLALESIRYGIFTSKSDVWSFGITIWELLTYGSIPYENIAAKDVADLIKVGQKLPQPDICSLDIYCVLLSCWVFDADARPTFMQLSETFAEKASDYSRYLDIPGDEFLELPSYTAKDEKKLIRKLATSCRKSIIKTTKNDQIRTNDDDMSEYIDLKVRNNQSENIHPTKTIPRSGYMNIAEVLVQQPSTSVNNPEYMISYYQPTKCHK